jgi:low affinity Fe/Cu permease
MVVGEFPQNKFSRDIRDLESKLNREINFTSYNKNEFEKERRKEGGFLHLVLEDKIVILKGALGAGETDQAA